MDAAKVGKAISTAADLLVYLEYETLTPVAVQKRDALAAALSDVYDDMARSGFAPVVL